LLLAWLVEMVFGVGDLFTGDQEPLIGVHQVLRSTTTSCLKLCQGDLRGRQSLLGNFFTDGQRRLIVASPLMGLANKDATSDCSGLVWLSVTNSSSTRLALLVPFFRQSGSYLVLPQSRIPR
jgi:hypothetical protein